MKSAISIATFSLLVLCVTAVLGRNIRTVVVTGQRAPSTTGGEVFSSLKVPVLNSSGKTAFYGVLTGSVVDGSNDLGIWSEGSGVLSLMARAGGQAPGTSAGTNFGAFFTDTPPLLNEAGQIAFTAMLSGSGVTNDNDAGIWSGELGSLGLVARDSDPAPGTSGGVLFSRIGGPFGRNFAFNNSGDVAFEAELVGIGVGPREGNNLGIWSSSNDVLTIVVRSGDQTPGSPAGVRFRAFEGPTLDQQGRTAFFANLVGVGSSFNRGIWSERSGSLSPIAREGDNAPDTADGVTFETFAFETPSINSAGQAAFFARIRGTGVTGNNDYGVWSEGSSALRLVARDGGIALGLDEQEVFFSDIGNPFSLPSINSAGDIAFSGSTRLANGSPIRSNGIWVERSGSLDLVVSSRMAIPGIAGDVTYRFLGQPALNAAGQVAFSSLLAGEGINGGNDKGIWAEDRQRELFLIAREGELLEVEPGDFRTIESLSFLGGTGNDDGRQSAFNDLGQLAFQARFTDGTEGIFVSNLVAVPEPSNLLLILSGMVFSVLSTAADRRTRR